MREFFMGARGGDSERVDGERLAEGSGRTLRELDVVKDGVEGVCKGLGRVAQGALDVERGQLGRLHASRTAIPAWFAPPCFPLLSSFSR